ncbi:hypothetical protein Pla110_36750 [Polystyrenella longa]|uniref:DUF997 family protein n=1 Tax=Polystyrenella longa TaxID=2528007 RepID=A0A518CRU7_9PLAN|nr:DUF997 family protein [Polystyrenella longa]QDU81924.1 hypothetical protein Pla110_36750 [Polystyrenella longa]
MPEQKLLGKYEYDPVFLNARKEAIVILFVWIFFFLWTVPYCYFNGYRDSVDPDNLELILGMPRWIVMGVGLPWLVADIVTILFATFYMKDDPLGEAEEGADLAEEIAEMHAADGKGGEA